MPEIHLYASETAFVSSAHQQRNYSRPDLLLVGDDGRATSCAWCGSGGEYVSLLRFGGLGAIPTDSRILQATLRLFLRNLWPKAYCTGVYANLNGFDAARVNWLNRPQTEEQSAGVLRYTGGQVCGFVSCDITALLARWNGGILQNHGISLLSPQNCLGLAQFDSAHSEYPPQLAVQYQEVVPQGAGSVLNEFQEHVYDISGAEEVCMTPSAEFASAKLISFFIKNNGAQDILVRLQIGPDNVDFADDAQLVTVQPGELRFVTPYGFAKFIRARIQNTQPGRTMNAKVWCQIQTNHYRFMIPGQ